MEVVQGQKAGVIDCVFVAGHLAFPRFTSLHFRVIYRLFYGSAALCRLLLGDLEIEGG
jgi:hypothetical protein